MSISTQSLCTRLNSQTCSEQRMFKPDEPPVQNLGDLWVDPTYIVHSNTLRINNPNQEPLPSDLNWLFLSLRRHISHHFSFSSHLGDTTSYHLQSLSVKPHFCCPEASDSLPARTQECVKIKGNFCHYPIWTPRYTDGEARFYPGKIHLHRMSRAAWNPITTAGKKGT